MTFAATGSRDVVVDAPIADLERRLDPADFLRIHRGTLVNVRFIAEAHAGFAGGMALRLKDPKRTSLQVARDRVREVKGRLDCVLPSAGAFFGVESAHEDMACRRRCESVLGVLAGPDAAPGHQPGDPLADAAGHEERSGS
jgi:hypothetical protein